MAVAAVHRIKADLLAVTPEFGDNHPLYALGQDLKSEK